MEMPISTHHIETITVEKSQLASSMKSGTVDVFATPFMIALMEYAAMRLIAPALPEGVTTVGTLVNITHTAPTLEGTTVRAEAELLESDGRRFVFRVTAFDEAGVIGEGFHERCSVKSDRFLQKAAERRDNAPAACNNGDSGAK